MKTRERYNLPSGKHANGYWAKVHVLASQLGSDGCTGVPDIYRDACYEHDIHYKTGKTIYGVALTRRDADAIFRERLQEMSFLGVFSPTAWTYWLGVRAMGDSRWKGEPEVYR
jgi:hypothetical protein